MAATDAPTAALLAERRRIYGPNTSVSYGAPLHIVRGAGAVLFDEAGAAYLDCVNNVAHVGHSNPAVAEAVASQMGAINTNSRYLSRGLVELSQQLLALLPDNLEVVYLCNSGSEANDLALRISRAAAAAAGRHGATHVACMGGAYHGHVTSTMAISPYKFWGRGGAGREAWVHVLPAPDPYRGQHLDGRLAARGAVAEARAGGGEVAAFICESVLSCGGQIFLPDGYLADVYAEMRAAGAVCIADEVQTGFGRVGEAFWGFQLSGVTPDIVVMGKPIGNGVPLAAVAVTRPLAEAFATQEYFNTFGGCNLATAAGLAVLSEIRRLNLQAHAAQVGAHLLSRLRGLQARHPALIGDVRGRGLFLGIEVVRDPASKAPAPATAKWIKEAARARGVLLSTDGPYEQVIKIKPPMVFSAENADTLVDTLDTLLAQVASDPQLAASLVAAEDAAATAQIAPIAAAYAENAARIFAFANAAASVACATTAGSDCSGEPCGGSPMSVGGPGRAAAVGALAGGKRRAGGARGGSLLRRVWSWASSARSDASIASAGEWEAAAAAAVAAARA